MKKSHKHPGSGLLRTKNFQTNMCNSLRNLKLRDQ